MVAGFFSAFVAFSLGVVVSGAIFSFIAMIGIVPRLAQKSQTTEYVKHYENVIILAGVWGASTLIFNYELNLPHALVWGLALSGGIFLGCLAVSLTEVLDVIPILMRRAKVAQGLKYFMLALAIGKGIGTLLYYYLNLQ